MCRFLVYKGKESILLADLIIRPVNSIINQSFDARLRLDRGKPLNGDGFGVGWYPEARDVEDDKTPGVFHSISPAWNDQNLLRLSEKIRSPMVFAHVRAASPGLSLISGSNCHPWNYGKLMFMHNGFISDFMKIKRRILNCLSDDLFRHVSGNTDSEHVFALFLNQLDDPLHGNFDVVTLKEAVFKTIRILNQFSKEAGVTLPSLMNFAITDGSSVICTRYVNVQSADAASLYYSSGTKFESTEPGHYRMIKADKRENLVVVASEPLTFESVDWNLVPKNTMLIITSRMNVLFYPIPSQLNDPLPH